MPRALSVAVGARGSKPCGQIDAHKRRARIEDAALGDLDATERMGNRGIGDAGPRTILVADKGVDGVAHVATVGRLPPTAVRPFGRSARSASR